MNPNERIIIALDFETADEAIELVGQLGDSILWYKIGLQLLTAEGPQVVKQLAAAGKRVFLDLKLLEIPNSVAGGVTSAGRLGASMVTVHASGGADVLQAAVKAAAPFPNLQVLAVTVITSLQDEDLESIGVSGTTKEHVLRLASLAADAGCHGVVASAREASLLRKSLPKNMSIVTPGTKMNGASGNDQKRTASPGDAIRAGATQLVIGRAIAQAAEPKTALAAILEEVLSAAPHEKNTSSVHGKA